MKKFLLGLLCGFLLAALATVIVGFAMIRLGDTTPKVPGAATLVLRLQGELPERNPVEIPIPWFQEQTPATVLEVRDVLHRAAADSRIKAVLFEPRGVGAGWAKAEEVRQSLVHFKKSGKPLIAYLRTPRAREYYMATAADRIYMTREDLLDLKGLRAELTYFRGTLDKLGVQLEVEHAGRYKDAADSFTRTAPTPETLEATNALLDGIYGSLIEVIAQGRKIAAADVRTLMDQGPFLAEQAKAKRLVDDLYFEDQVTGELKKRLGQTELERISHYDYARVPPSSRRGARVAVIVGEGDILRGGAPSGFGDEGLFSVPFIRMLRDVGDDASIRGVILRVNSPGGDAVASDEILREVNLLASKKPLVISMSDLAASGGYFISMSGDPIVAYPNTITGSIGVIYGKLNLANLYSKIGVNKEILTRGRNADIDSDAVPLDEEGRKKLREGVESVYQSFLARVAEGRKMKVSEVAPLAEGRVWLGSHAKNIKLVDDMGGFDRAIERIRERAKIPADQQIRLIAYPGKKSVFEQLFGRTPDVLAAARAEVRRHAALTEVARMLGIDAADLRLWLPGGYLRIAPYSIRVN